MSDEPNSPEPEMLHEEPEEAPQYREISSDELRRVLKEHKNWVESKGKEGKRADLKRANLQRADLQMANLQMANLQMANLFKANLQMANLFKANLQKAYLHEANLQSSDLEQCELNEAYLAQAKIQYARLQNAELKNVKCLLAGQLAGASVSGAKLPEDIKKFEGLTQVEKISQRAQKLFLSFLLGCVYCWLTISTTTDVGLLTNSSSSPLPIIQTKIPIAGFYWTAPLILLSLYFWFHLYLQRLWEWLVTLPAVFPDGERLDRKVYPWLVSGIASSHIPTLKGDPLPLSRLQTWISILLAWWIVPLTFVFFWLRYLPKHEWGGTIEHVALIVIAWVFAAWSYTLARKTLRRQKQQSIDLKNGWKTWGFYKSLLLRGLKFVLSGIGLLVLTAIVYGISDGAINGMVPKERAWAFACSGGKAEELGKGGNHTFFSGWIWALKEATAPLVITTKQSLVWLRKVNGEASPTFKSTLRALRSQYREVIPMILPCFGSRAFADLKEQEVSTRPANWFVMRELDSKKMVDIVTGANLQGADLRGASAREVFLMKADLRGADLRKADFILANIEKGKLQEAKLQRASLTMAKLQQADLRGTQLLNADLSDAQLQGADLGEAQLQKANLVGAQLQKAILLKAQLQEAILRWANLQEANLERAELKKVNLGGANLKGARLVKAQLQQARLFEAQLQQADLSFADLRGADGLSLGQLKKARNWVLAYYDPAPLSLLGLPSEHNTNLLEHNFSNYALSGLDLKGAIFSNFNLGKANLQGAILFSASMYRANLESANLQEANLSGADLQGANLTSANLLRAMNLTQAQLNAACSDGGTQLDPGFNPPPPCAKEMVE